MQLLYVPQLTLSLLTATAFSYRADHNLIAGALHAISWIAQFYGHGVHEKRAPALLDNLIGGAFHASPRLFEAPSESKLTGFHLPAL